MDALREREQPRFTVAYVDDEIGTPNCPRRLVPMTIPDDLGPARWKCPECGTVKLS